MSHPTAEKPSSGSRTLIVGVFAGVTSALALVIILMVILSATDPANTDAAGYLPLAYSAFAVVLAAVIVGAFVRRVRVQVIGWVCLDCWGGFLCSQFCSLVGPGWRQP